MPNQTTTHTLARRHEALWLRVQSLHKEISAIAVRRPQAPVSEPVRVTAEALLSDCAPFTPERQARLPVAAMDAAGLAVQLGQALARLEAYEALHSEWVAQHTCRCWRIKGESVPVARLKPQYTPTPTTTYSGKNMRSELERRIDMRERAIYERGYKAGRLSRIGPPVPESLTYGQDEPEWRKTYPRLRIV